MIYCPQCGTANKPNSKFCKNCAALLAPSTDVRCPICGTMNPAGAATCSNCDTRLTTTSATPSDRTTPADTPENITPFTPPEMTQAEDENQGARTSPASTRPSFTRSSSEWLRRVQKTPPPADSSLDNATAAAAATAASAAAAAVTDTKNLSGAQTSAQAPVHTEQDDIPEWLREIQNEAQRQAALEQGNANAPDAPVEHETPEVAPIVAGAAVADALLDSAAPAKPPLSEIKLTGDDYDYSDIAGEVTPEMQAALQANADKLQSVDDETALARKLLGLDVEETPSVTSEASNVAPVAAGIAAASALSSDEPVVMASETSNVTSETLNDAPAIAQEEEGPSAAKIIAGVAAAGTVASKILGDEQETQNAQVATPPPAKSPLSEIKLTGDDYDYSDIAGEVTPEMQAALQAHADKLQSVDDETALARKLLGLDVEEPVGAGETSNVAPLAAGAVTASALSGDVPVADATSNVQADEGHSTAKIIAGVAAAGTVAAKMLDSDDDAVKPQVSEPQAVVAADSAALAQEAMPTALAGETPLPAETETSAALPAAVAAPVTEQTVEQSQTDADQAPDWVTVLAAASSAAVVAAVVSDKGEAETPQVPAQADAESDVPPALAVGATAATLDAASDTLDSKPVPPLETGEMPEWLREIAPEEITGTTPLTPDEEGALPAWVQELAPAAVGLGTVAYLSQLPELDEEERGDLPDWLREPVAPEPEAVAGAAAAAALAEGVSEDAPLEIPSWFSDPAVTSPAADPFEVVEMTGPLAGISGILPLALAITEPHTLTTPLPARSDGGRIFQTLLAEPLASTARAEPEAKTRRWFNANHILYLLIFLAALIPLFFGLEQAGLGLNAVESGTALFYDELQAIPANGTTVVAFEYTPGSAVELDPAARAIVNDLAARRVNVIALTSNPNGVTLAENILQRAQETHPDFTYVNVGYIPGNDAGLRALASGWLPAGRQDVNGVPWGSTPLGGAVRNMDELALTVLIVGDDLTMRNWMEQVEPRITSSIVAATSAMLEPQARNYVNASQLQASLRGLTGAAELELLTNQTGQAVKTVDAFSIVSLLLAGIIIVGNIIFILRRKK